MRQFVGFLACAAAGAAGCGRLGFGDRSGGPTADDDGRGSDAALPTDAAALGLGVCGAAATAPDPIHIAGITFTFADFANTRNAVPGVTVDVLDRAHPGAILASTVSDAAGLYALSVPTGGAALVAALRYTVTGWFTTTTYLDAPLDRDLALGDQRYLNASDGPLWNTGSMGSVYGSVGLTADPARSTVNISAFDCAGLPLAGVAIPVSPAPEVAEYIADSGFPDSAATATQGQYAAEVAYNAVAGPTDFTPTDATHAFPAQHVDIPAGDQVTMIRVRPRAP